MAETEDPLEDFFEAGRKSVPEASDALLARIEADALAVIDQQRAPAEATPGWRGVLAALGGWRAGAGLATAALAGLAIGAVLPADLAGFDLALLPDTGYGIADFAPGYGFDLLEDG